MVYGMSCCPKRLSYSDGTPSLKSYVQTIRLKPRSGSFKVPFHELLGQMYNAFVGAVDKLKHIHGMVPNLIFVPIYQNEIKGFHRNGGNAIGLRESDGPLLSMWYFCLNLNLPTGER